MTGDNAADGALPLATPDALGGGDLTPCPFCGGGKAFTGETLDFRKGADRWFATCARDQCAFLGYYPTEAEAIAAWNTRAPDHRLAALEGEGERLQEALGGEGKLIAAWLRGEAEANRKVDIGGSKEASAHRFSLFCTIIADAIERGEHLPLRGAAIRAASPSFKGGKE